MNGNMQVISKLVMEEEYALLAIPKYYSNPKD
jgi:hypothetical protein